MNDVVILFSIFHPGVLGKKSETNIIKAATDLQIKYPNDLSTGFPLQLLSFHETMKNEINGTTTIRQLADMLIVQYSAISSTYPDVCTALILFLTLPVTVASAGRGHSQN
jgi:hypothetical protein